MSQMEEKRESVVRIYSLQFPGDLGDSFVLQKRPRSDSDDDIKRDNKPARGSMAYSRDTALKWPLDKAIQELIANAFDEDHKSKVEREDNGVWIISNSVEKDRSLLCR